MMREDWEECSLIEGCDIHDNLRKPINSKERNGRINGKTQDQLYPYYGATGQVGFIDNYLTNDDYVLIGEDAAPFLDYSKDVAYQIFGKTWVNNHAHILKSKFNNMFLLHYLNNFNYKDYVSGTTRLKLTQGRLKQIPIKIAPLPEQRAIVAKIEELFSDLDKGIADLKKAQGQLKIYRQAVLKKAFEGELTKEWREQQTDLPSADELLNKIKEERQKYYAHQLEDWKQAVKSWEGNGKEGKKPGKPKLFESLPDLTEDELNELATLPMGWSWFKNESFLFEVKDGTHDTPKYQEDGTPFITQKNIKNNSVSFSDVKYISDTDHKKFFQRSNVQKGDIIIAMIGHGRGSSCIVDTDRIFSIKNVGLFKFFNSIHNNQYCLHYYQSTLGLNLALKKSKGGAQPFIGLTEL
ncbi:MAG: restriction endonuclease subunit S, partial [Mariprofundaceae bacterium]|nr:restriction endonuclease subunit S [Mariprofundaceae bacterium]